MVECFNAKIVYIGHIFDMFLIQKPLHLVTILYMYV